ncbi:hypothetical protein BC831DRAFT_385591, partial [Entophlyctis helioformis]
EEIRKAYRKLALQHHPDKIPVGASDEQRAEATAAFQRLSKAYAVLSDSDRRATYDLTGSLQDSILDLKSSDVSWATYFRELWSGVVSEQTITDFKVKYQCKYPSADALYSEEERRDVLASYVKAKGVLLDIIDLVPLSNLYDIDRFQTLIQDAIDAGEVEQFKKFPIINQRELARRRAQLEKEARADLSAESSGVSSLSSSSIASSASGSRSGSRPGSASGSEAALAALIKARNASRLDSLVERLEQKYGGKTAAK